VSEVRRVDSPAEVEIDGGRRGNLARGLGRAYGDAALNGGGVVWDTTGLDSIEIDTGRSTVRVGAGVSYARLLEACLPHGCFPPVTPGSKHVTMGGAIAADVHGKNHHRDGSLRRHVRSLEIRCGDGEVRHAEPGHDLFEATFGGMGLTGIILSATLDLLEIPSQTMTVETVRTESLDATLTALVEADTRNRYTVAWVDLSARGRMLGRGVVDAGDHTPAADAGTRSSAGVRHALVTAPPGLPSGLVNRASVRLFNEVWHRRAPRRGTITGSIDSFFYPLDAIGDWNRLYGRRGFVQYQFVVPDGAESALASIIELISSGGAPALTVLKRFGDGGGLLSFPMKGWTVSVDFPVARGELAGVLDRADARVAEAGGRVYLAKDARLHRGLVGVMYPELDKWRDIADTYDPDRLFRSDLDRRLGLRDRP
jgi:decaprenylphospho-beta-D-ribofuranose 2-oxidase